MKSKKKKKKRKIAAIFVSNFGCCCCCFFTEFLMKIFFVCSLQMSITVCLWNWSKLMITFDANNLIEPISWCKISNVILILAEFHWWSLCIESQKNFFQWNFYFILINGMMMTMMMTILLSNLTFFFILVCLFEKNHIESMRERDRERPE